MLVDHHFQFVTELFTNRHGILTIRLPKIRHILPNHEAKPITMIIAAQQARQGIAPALETLREIAETPGNPQARIMAARSTLEYSLRLTERADFLERLENLEKMQKEGGH